MSCTRVKYLSITSNTSNTLITPNTSSPKYIANQLMLLSYVMASRGDTFRARAYETAAKIVLKTPLNTILTSKVEGIGNSSKQRITTIMNSSNIPELSNININTILELSRINGIGLKEAKRLTDLGVTSIQDLRNKYELKLIHLNNNQVFGMYNFDQLEKTISRSEVKSIGNSILALLPTNCFGEITGSYRRSNDNLGDIDLIITCKIGNPLDYLINQLNSQNLLVHTFSHGPVKFRGVYVGMRKLDITYANIESWAAALLHSTGSRQFNIKLRQIAIDKGFKLNEKGLFTFSGQQIYTSTEAEIFNILGLQYVPPDGRNVV